MQIEWNSLQHLYLELEVIFNEIRSHLHYLGFLDYVFIGF